MSDGEWRTFKQLINEAAVQGVYPSENGVSARIRDLRKPKFGGHRVDKKRISGGLYAYRLVV
jgi:hypothetical protein